MSDTSGVPSDGGAASPSPAPASTPSPAPSGGSPGQSYDFMSEVFGAPDASPPAEKPGAEPQAAPATPEPTQPQPAPTPAQPAPAPAAPEPTVAQPTSPQGAPQTAAEPAKFDPADPISLARGLDENREAAIEHLAQTAFRLEPKELEELEVDLANAVPKLLAKTVVFAQTQFLTQLSRVVPLMIQRHGKVTETHQKNLSEFYTAWPGLDPTKHGPMVNEIAIRYRQLFPQATKEQMIEQLGPMVLVQAGLPMTAMHRGTAPASPKANGSPPRSGQPKAAGFVPAAPGTVAQLTTVPEDPWSYMGPEQG